eukprot:gb/GEZN01004184.1/.p1 GENE.gb/GEZN01004184.1/~~gb/GEZN01004184.1/.p1  ORF type:complete len:639 (+),score=73.27 gb/GEZN01004184.1/:170-1918(+)
MLLTAAGGIASHHRFSFWGKLSGNEAAKSKSDNAAAFFPRNGVEKVLVSPGVPIGLAAFVPGISGPSCLFAYADQVAHDVADPLFMKGAVVEDGWIYGAELGATLAEPTGAAENVLKGKLLCWPDAMFLSRLKTADGFRHYDSENTLAGVRRSTCEVVRKDGTSRTAFWYYHGADSSERGYRAATELFSEWADQGRDQDMIKNHEASVKIMLEMALPLLPASFRAVDLGCGNGWVTRKIALEKGCSSSIGIDGSFKMIEKAKSLDPGGVLGGEYQLAVLPDWQPPHPFEFVFSMEFLYFLADPATMLRILHDSWLTPGGVLVAGLDFYSEHMESATWSALHNVWMARLSKDDWEQAMVRAGFHDVQVKQVNKKAGSVSTLVMLGRKLGETQLPKIVKSSNGLVLPNLTPTDQAELAAGRVVQQQTKVGNKGNGWIVLDVEAPVEAVWAKLADLEHYDQFIPTVRFVEVTSSEKRGEQVVSRSNFIVSRWRLHTSTIHTYRPAESMLEFELDENGKNVVLKDAAGFFYTEQPRAGVTRVFLVARLTVSSMIPRWLIDYAAERALRRATNWIIPAVTGQKEDTF